MTELNYDENWAKRKLKRILDDHKVLHVPIPATGMGVSGVSDRLACLNGIFIAIEVKRPGRRGQKHRGCSELQAKFLKSVSDHAGIAVVFDGEQDDVEHLEMVLGNVEVNCGTNVLDMTYWRKK